MRTNRWPWFRSRPSLGFEVNPEDIFLDSVNLGEFDTDRLEGRLESALGHTPFVAVAFVIALGMAILGVRAGILQVARGQELAQRAEENRIFSVTLPAPRGIIYDRNRQVLVTNTPSFEVVLRASELPKEVSFRDQLLAALGDALGKSREEILDAGFNPMDEPGQKWSEIVVASDISREQVLDIQSRPQEFPGAVIREREQREYPGPAFAHVIGYVGKVSPEDIAKKPTYNLSDMIGKSGIEFQYESELKGSDGRKLVEVNSRNSYVSDLPQEKPIIGNSFVLNIDADLQRVLYNSMRTHLEARNRSSGSAVILDPRDGAVRAMVSFPSFDPNIFRQKLSQRDYEAIFLSKYKPFFNRAIGGEYPSGSVIKPLVAVAALEERVIDPNRTINDTGSISVPNPYRPGEETVFPDWKAHGVIDMRSALQWSANVYFYIVGGGYKDVKGLGITKLGNWMKKFGLGSVLGIDLPGEKPGLVPGPENIAKTRPSDPVWRLGDTYHAAIGQGSFQATPLQIAAMTAAIANGGTLWQPQLVREVLDSRGEVTRSVEPRALAERLADPRSLEIAREGMRLVATKGTARLFFADFPVEVAGKTGTAQTGLQHNAHGWFTAFAPYAAPELAMVVMAEDVYENESIATPVTRDVLYWYFTRGANSATSSAVSAYGVDG